MIADRLREKADEWEFLADGGTDDPMTRAKLQLAAQARLLADCYAVMLDRPTVSDEFISRTLARIEEVAR